MKNRELEKYINDIQSMEQGELGELQAFAYRQGLPIIPAETARFLRTLISITQPLKILEIGCAVGFSACLMAEYMPKEGRVTTIDRFPIMIEHARENFKKMDKNGMINLIEGDAKDVLPLLTPYFDLIFLDAAKGQYIQFLPECIRLLRKGGVLVCDDVLQEGAVAKGRSEVEKRQRTIHRRLRAFLWQISNTEGLESSILTIGDGLTVTVKKEENIVFKEIYIDDF